jgi:hypothetical protein
MLYRIYTEDVNRNRVEAIASARLPEGFTLLTGRGCWHGSCENSLVIEATGIDKDTANLVASDIKLANDQESVLVIGIPVESEFV